MAKLRYLETAMTNQNLIDEAITVRLNVSNTCYRLVQNLLSSCLISILYLSILLHLHKSACDGLYIYSWFLSKKLQITIYKTIILSAVSYGCETWTLTLGEEYKLAVFENRVLKRIFGSKMDKARENCIMRSFITLSLAKWK
jgi:hypothetical protein